MNKTLSYLQIARGIAALIVVLHHVAGAELFYFGFISFADIFTAGWNAVDFFFVLSGFIIFYIHSKDLGHRARWRHYISKRIIRIYPIYWFVALISLALIFIGSSHVSRSDISNISARPLYIFKSFFLIPQPTDPFVGVAWSLCYEMFFYLVFGLGILFDKRILWVFPMIYLGINTARVFYPAILGDSYALAFLSGNFHLEFLFGILTAWYFNAGQQWKGKPMNERPAIRWIWVAGLLLFAFTWYLTLTNPNSFGKFTLYSRLFYGFSSALIILGVSQWKLNSDNAITRFFLLLGDASYSLYLIHTLVLALLFKFITRIQIPGKIPWVNYSIYLVATGCCVLTGILLHKKIEKPMISALSKALPKKKELIRSIS